MFSKTGRERRKFPAAASLFDIVGPYPSYVVVAEFLVIPFFPILYLPFALANRRPA